MQCCIFQDSWKHKCQRQKDDGQLCQDHKSTFHDIRERRNAHFCVYNRWDDLGKFRCNNKTIYNNSLCQNCYKYVKYNPAKNMNNRNKVQNEKLRHDPYSGNDKKTPNNVEKVQPVLIDYKFDIPDVEFIPLEKPAEVSDDNEKKAIDFLNTIQNEFNEKKRLFDEHQALVKRIEQANKDIANLLSLQLEVVNLNNKKEELEGLMKSELSKASK